MTSQTTKSPTMSSTSWCGRHAAHSLVSVARVGYAPQECALVLQGLLGHELCAGASLHLERRRVGQREKPQLNQTLGTMMRLMSA